MKKLRLNINYRGWNNLQNNWKLSTSFEFFFQKNISGSIFSAFDWIQSKLCRKMIGESEGDVRVFIIGYWRSGTTLLHEYLTLDPQYRFPTTYACMNPHHFVMTQAAALAHSNRQLLRPMDGMAVHSATPQEDEFALLCMGARSPYEALLVPEHLSEALSLGDPEDLTPDERREWHEKFRDFLRGLSVTCGGRALILKSPTHGYRISTLRRMYPDARFVLIVRNPYEVFDSAVNMWQKLAGLYAIGPLPTVDSIRDAVMKDRHVFEAKLEAGLAGLPANRHDLVRYEDLVSNPVEVLRGIYERLDLGEYSLIVNRIEKEFDERRKYKAKSYDTGAGRGEKLAHEWAEIFNKYKYIV